MKLFSFNSEYWPPLNPDIRNESADIRLHERPHNAQTEFILKKNAIKDVIKQIDLNDEKIVVHLLKGLVED